MDPRRANLEAQKARDYRKYKQFQKRFEYLLKAAEDEEQLNNMTIGQLLNAYSKVEQMYLMRTDYRNKYFTVENWDIGHQRFIGYLVSVMNVYENELEERFEELMSQLDEEEEERFARLSLSDLSVESESEMRQLGKIMPRIRMDLERRRREEEEVWNVEIPDLIAERRQKMTKAIKFLEVMRKVLLKFKPDISEAETIHVYHYTIVINKITQMERLLNPDGTINMKNLPVKPFDKIVKPYPITFEEYAKELIINNENYQFNESLKQFYEITKFSLFPNLMETIFDITRVTRQYAIYRDNIHGVTVFVPILPYDPNAIISIIGKYAFGLSIPSGHIGIMAIGTNQ